MDLKSQDGLKEPDPILVELRALRRTLAHCAYATVTAIRYADHNAGGAAARRRDSEPIPETAWNKLQGEVLELLDQAEAADEGEDEAA